MVTSCVKKYDREELSYLQGTVKGNERHHLGNCIEATGLTDNYDEKCEKMLSCVAID